MPEFLSMPIVLALFYIVLSGQIFLLSIYYPRKLSGRVEHMLKNFPPAEYPKLYPSFHAGYVEIEKLKMRIYKIFNYLVAVLGISVLVAMLISGYRPAEKGGDEIFVMLYFFLQTLPLLYISWKEHLHYRQMRLTFDDKKRTADLVRRGLFDFISPIYVVIAISFFCGWLAFYTNGAGPVAGWEIENYATVGLITLMNAFYALTVFAFVSGKKLDPYKAPKDQRKHAESMVKVMVFSSIMISVFLSIAQAADQYAFEILDPVMTSFYMQLCIIFGLGLTMRLQDFDDIDFEVYRDSSEVTHA